MTAGQGAAGLRDGGSREQHAQTVTREKILPRPNTERTGANRTKNKREIWHLPKRHPIKPAALSGEQGSSRDLQAPHSTQEEPIPPPTGNGESRYGQRHTDRAWQRMGELSADETNLLSPSPGIRNVALPWQPPPRHVWHSVKAAGAPCLRPPGQEDRLQDLVTSTPDLWHHLPPHFSIPPPMVPVALSCAQPLGSLLQPDLNGARWDFCSFLPQLPQSLLPWLRESCQRFALPSFHSTKPIAHRPAEFLIMESSQSNGSPLCPTAHPPSDAALARAGSCATPSSSSPKLPGRRGP